MSKLGPHFIGAPGVPRWIAAGARVLKFDPTGLGASSQAPPGPVVVGKLDQEDAAINLTDWKALMNRGITPQAAADLRFNAQRNIYAGANRPRVDRYLANPRVDVWEDDNEVMPDTPDEARWYAAYCVAMMQLYESIGRKRANFSFAVGTPDIRPGHADDIWPHLLPAVRYARDHGHYIALHEYMGFEADLGVGWRQIDGNRKPLRVWHGRKQADGRPDESYPYGWTVLRYRLIYDTYFAPAGLGDVKLLITELGCDSVESVTPVGMPVGTWREHSPHWRAAGLAPEQVYANMLKWYDARIAEDSFVAGAMVFTVGSVGVWASWDIAGTSVESQLLEYIHDSAVGEPPSPAPPPPPPPTPPSTPPPARPVKVIDISKWQGAIDTAKMKAAGVDGVMVRASYAGSKGSRPDEKVDEYVAALKAAGIPFGFYHYFHPARPVDEQFAAFQSVVDRHGYSLRLALDLEETGGLDSLTAAKAAIFAARVRGEYPLPANGRHLIYTSLGYWRGSLGSPTWGADFDLWIAAWTSAAKPAVPAPWTTWTLWQYTSSGDGRAHGVGSTRVDINRFNGDQAAFAAWQVNGKPADEVPSLATVLWRDAEARPDAFNVTYSLPKAIMVDGRHPFPGEHRIDHDGATYVYQIGVDAAGRRRVYYAPMGRWNEIKWIAGPGETLPAPPPIPPPPTRIDLLPYLRGEHRRQFDMGYDGGTQTTQVWHLSDKDWVFVKGENGDYERLGLRMWNGQEWIFRFEDTSESAERFYAHYLSKGGPIGAPWFPRYAEIGKWYETPKYVQHYLKAGCAPQNGGDVTDKLRLLSGPRTVTYSESGVKLDSVITLEWDEGEQYDFALGRGNVAFRDGERRFWFIGDLLGRADKPFRKPGCIQLGW